MSRILINARFASQRMTGVPRSAYEIVRRLVDRDEERYRLLSPVESEIDLPNVEKTGRIRQGHLWEQLELPVIARNHDRDAVLYSPASSGPIAVTRQVMTVHDLFPIEYPEWFSRSFSTWYKAMLPPLLKRVSCVIANSEYTRKRTIELFGLPPEKVVLAHFAYDEDRFHPSAEDEVEAFRKAWDLPERYVLFIGSLEPRKNLRTLTSAWAESDARKRGDMLVIVGAAGRKDVFRASPMELDAIEDGSVRLMGFVDDDDLPRLYQAASVLALPSLAEGFGLPVLEAMACGTPVVCADNTALPEVAGDAARLIPALDIPTWRDTLDEVLEDVPLRLRMRNCGLERAAEFSWSHTAEIVRSVLEKLHK